MYRITLIDLSTGKPHTVSGVEISVDTTEPDYVKRQWFRNRNPEQFDVKIEKIENGEPNYDGYSELPRYK